MSQFEFDALLQKYLSGECTPEEEAIVLEGYRAFIRSSGIDISATEKQNIERRIWSGIRGTITGAAEDAAPVRPMRRRIARFAAAASVALLAMAGLYWLALRPAAREPRLFTEVSIPGHYELMENKTEDTQLVRLADGSSVQVQPGGALYYPAKFSGATRDVYLSGNAFFQVAPDAGRHFMVHTDEGMIAEVLGTSFYVRHDEVTRKVEVAVVTGRVSVYERRRKGEAQAALPENSIIITPNQQVTFKAENNQFVTSLVEDPRPVATPAAPQEHRYVFEDEPLGNVLQRLEETYGIRISTNSEHFNNCHFTGDITKQNLYGKLDIICKSVQASYEVKGTSIYLNGTGCN